MALIHEIITSENIKGFYNAKNENVGNTLGENAFPPKQQLGLKLSFIKGAAGKPVTLKAAAFDTKVPLRDRMAVELLDEKNAILQRGYGCQGSRPSTTQFVSSN